MDRTMVGNEYHQKDKLFDDLPASHKVKLNLLY